MIAWIKTLFAPRARSAAHPMPDALRDELLSLCRQQAARWRAEGRTLDCGCLDSGGTARTPKGTDHA